MSISRKQVLALYNTVTNGTPGEAVDAISRALLDAKAGSKKEARELRKHLKVITEGVVQFLQWLDAEMKKPSSVERGQRIAQAAGALELANDQALHFGLDVPLSSLTPGKRPGEAAKLRAEAKGGRQGGGT